MCKIVEITVYPNATVAIYPTECTEVVTACRELSKPYLKALARSVLSDIDIDFGRSHVIAIDLEREVGAALEAAAEKCGLVAVETQEWDWYGSWQKDYSAENAAYKNGVPPSEYGKCDFALVQADSPLGKAELAARAGGTSLTAAEIEALRVKHYGQGWQRNTSKPYSIGVLKDKEAAGYKLVYDFWGGGYGLRDKIGNDARKLKVPYALQAARNEAVKNRHKVISETTHNDGRIVLKVKVPDKLTLG